MCRFLFNTKMILNFPKRKTLLLFYSRLFFSKQNFNKSENLQKLKKLKIQCSFLMLVCSKNNFDNLITILFIFILKKLFIAKKLTIFISEKKKKLENCFTLPKHGIREKHFSSS